MWSEFHALCDLGGRLAGSPSEAAALAWARERLAAIPGGRVREHPVAYPGWRCRTAQLIDAASGKALRCTPLLGTAATAGLTAEVVDLGLGRCRSISRATPTPCAAASCWCGTNIRSLPATCIAG